MTGLCSGMPNTALDDVCTTFATRASRARDQHVGGAADVHRVEQRAVLGQRHLRDVVEHDVDALARGAHRGAVAHVARDELGARSSVGPGGLRSKIRTASPRASACSASTVPK